MPLTMENRAVAAARRYLESLGWTLADNDCPTLLIARDDSALVAALVRVRDVHDEATTGDVLGGELTTNTTPTPEEESAFIASGAARLDAITIHPLPGDRALLIHHRDV